MAQLYFLIYVSIASDPLGNERLLDILRASRENNSRNDITGLLLYKERRFMQILEGPETLVCATYARILGDPRHREVTVLLKGGTAERDFADWAMGFQDLNDEVERATPGYSPFLDAKFSVFEFASDPSRAHKLLRIFRRM
ncbi:MAG: BLUF domain-containing protein [Chthoniobacterales bacterium]|nr:BLUF domain-containing protein [Chthoniobacterales bacterium]